MAGTFFGIETASRALRTNQMVLDVIGHNVSNVDTPGYSRQTAEIRATDPYQSNAAGLAGVALGTGVELGTVNRVRDEFVERRLNDALADQGRYRQLNDTLTRVQSAFNDPGGAGMNNALTAFFNSFQDVSRYPESAGPRTLVQHHAADVARRFQDIHDTLSGQSLDILEQARATIEQVNKLAREIAGLNREVQESLALGGQPNDLMDRRDGLVKQVTELVGATVIEEQDGTGRKNGAVNLSVGGIPIVQTSTVVELPATFETRRGVAVLVNGEQEVPIQSGEVAGLIESNRVTQSYLNELNTLAATFIEKVNAQHRAGYGLDGQTGRPLFSGTDASNIAIDTIAANDIEVIAAATAPSPGLPVAAGNGDNARAIANMAHETYFGTMTMQDYYAQTVTRIGSDARSFERQSATQTQVIQQLQIVRDSVSGVSLDEELARMVTYQRAYQAAARLISVYDGLIEQMISTIGR